MPLIQPRWTQCTQGAHWYTCKSNGFAGCCTVDPCNLSECPDSAPTTSRTPNTVTVVIVGAEPTTKILTAVSMTASAPFHEEGILTATSAKPSNTIWGDVSSTTKSTGPTETSAAALVAPTSAGDTTKAVPHSNNAKSAWIGGSVAGGVVVLLLAVLLWYLARRRKQMRLSAYNLARQSPREIDSGGERSLVASDVFARFGGYHKEPDVEGHGRSTRSTNSQASLARHSETRLAQEDAQDEPLPDPEKQSVTPPPLLEHPALHPRPGDSPEVPAYMPGMATPAANPQVNPFTQRPALRAQRYTLQNIQNAKAPKPSGLCSRFSTNSSEQSRAFSYLPTPVEPLRVHKRSESHNPLMGFDSTQNPISDMRSGVPFHLSHPNTSELPAVVPQELTGSHITPHNQSHDLLINQNDALRSTYSIPIGLGVESTTSNPHEIPSNLGDRERMEEAGEVPNCSAYELMSHQSPRNAGANTYAEVVSPFNQLSPCWSVSPELRSPDIRSPRYQQDAASPDIRSPHYQQDIVSPPAPDTPAAPFNDFDFGRNEFRSSFPTERRLVPGHWYTADELSAPLNSSRSQPIMRPQTPFHHSPTKMDTPTPTQPKTIPNRRSRSPILRLNEERIKISPEKLKVHSTIGKGKERVTAWASYGQPTTPATPAFKIPTRHTTPYPGRRNGEDGAEPETDARVTIYSASSYSTYPGEISPESSTQVELPARFPGDAQDQYLNQGHEQRHEEVLQQYKQGRWSGSTATTSSCTTLLQQSDCEEDVRNGCAEGEAF